MDMTARDAALLRVTNEINRVAIAHRTGEGVAKLERFWSRVLFLKGKGSTIRLVWFWLVWFGWFGLVGLVWFGLVGLVGLVWLVWFGWFG